MIGQLQSEEETLPIRNGEKDPYKTAGYQIKVRAGYGLTPQLPLWNLHSSYSLGISNHVKIRFLLKSCSKSGKQLNEELFLKLNIKQKALLSRTTSVTILTAIACSRVGYWLICVQLHVRNGLNIKCIEQCITYQLGYQISEVSINGFVCWAQLACTPSKCWSTRT